MSVKNLIARTYYDMKEFELLLYHIDTTKHFLKNNKDLGNVYREINGNFFNYLNLIVTAIEKKDRNKLIKIEENIRKDKSVNNKIWLLEKLSELKLKNPAIIPGFNLIILINYLISNIFLTSLYASDSKR